MTEQVFHLLLQDSELPVKVDAAVGLQFLVKFQELCECDGRGEEGLGRCSWWSGGGECVWEEGEEEMGWWSEKSGDNVRGGWYNSRRGKIECTREICVS